MQTEEAEIDQLRKLMVDIPHSIGDRILKIFRARLLPTLPKTTRTFLGTTKCKYDLVSMDDADGSKGEYVYTERLLGLISHQRYEARAHGVWCTMLRPVPHRTRKVKRSRKAIALCKFCIGYCMPYSIYITASASASASCLSQRVLCGTGLTISVRLASRI